MQVANMRPEKNRESFSTSACGNDRHVRSNRWTVLVPPVSVVKEIRGMLLKQRHSQEGGSGETLLIFQGKQLERLCIRE